MTVKFHKKVAIRGPLTVGKDDYGYDVTMYGATSGCFWRWDESVNTIVRDGGSVFVKAVASGDGGITVGTFSNDTIGSTTEDGYIVIQVDATEYKVPFWEDDAG